MPQQGADTLWRMLRLWATTIVLLLMGLASLGAGVGGEGRYYRDAWVSPDRLVGVGIVMLIAGAYSLRVTLRASRAVTPVEDAGDECDGAEEK